MDREAFLHKFGERIKYRRKAMNITQSELAEMAGYTSSSTIAKIESGLVDVPQSKIEKIAKALDCSIAYLLHTTNNPNQERSDPSNLYSEDVVSYRALSSVRAGYGGACIEVPTGDVVDIPLSMLKGRKRSDFFVLRVEGNSMYPKILDGDFILCFKTDMVNSGTIAVVAYGDEEATVKKVRFDPLGRWVDLIPLNYDYNTMRIEEHQLDDFRVLGQVVKLIRDI